MERIALYSAKIGSIFIIVVALGAVTIPTTFADQDPAIVLNTEGSAIPGCEETNDCFVPSTVTINVGGEVVWKNVDRTYHSATSGIIRDGGPDGVFDSGLFPPGTEFSHTFDAPGEYPYYCIVHPWMRGLVIVQEAVEDTPSGQPYVSTENNFFIEFSEGWTVQSLDSIDQPNVIATNPTSDTIPSNITLHIKEAGNHTLNSIRESRIADLEGRADDGSFQVLNNTLTTINNLDAFIFDTIDVLDSDDSTIETKHREVTIMASGKIYTFLLSTARNNFDSEVRMFDHSLKSFTTDAHILSSGYYYEKFRTLILSFEEPITLSDGWQNSIQLRSVGPSGTNTLTPSTISKNLIPDDTSMVWIVFPYSDVEQLADITSLTVVVEPDTFTDSQDIYNGLTIFSVTILD